MKAARYIVRSRKEVEYFSGARYVAIYDRDLGFIIDFDCDAYHFITWETAQAALLACADETEFEVAQVTYVLKRTDGKEGWPQYVEQVSGRNEDGGAMLMFNGRDVAKRFTREDARAVANAWSGLKVVRLVKVVPK